MNQWTTKLSTLIKGIKVGDIICLQSYAGAKTYNRYKGITQKYCSHMRAKVSYHEFESLYYISRYDRHLNGKTSGYTFIPESMNYLNYPAKQCKRVNNGKV